MRIPAHQRFNAIAGLNILFFQDSSLFFFLKRSPQELQKVACEGNAALQWGQER